MLIHYISFNKKLTLLSVVIDLIQSNLEKIPDKMGFYLLSVVINLGDVTGF